MKHIFAAMDTETTGLEPGYHEPIQVAVVPVDPVEMKIAQLPHFEARLRPQYPERASDEALRVNGLSIEDIKSYPSRDQVAEDFNQWFRGLNLGEGGRVIPICHNSPFDVPMMVNWLGHEQYYEIFSRRCRCSMQLAASMNDAAFMRGEAQPFNKVGLGDLCKELGIVLDNAHDALADTIATAKVYLELLRRMN